ncbi:hypothetical protein IE53DRAFT_146370 [Violaceomyces palustris]|uniref:Uncharacterized protein n=1 Tax=Violaceomyces palustris TaxID=1673888 RepID=A0ACD0NUD3_9BASI|nr:hypothetical protein IE53DRAFT_146370 [Violaceomyces palustris]
MSDSVVVVEQLTTVYATPSPAPTADSSSSSQTSDQSSSSTVSSSAASSTSSSNASSSSTNGALVGAVAGGLVGGFAFFTLLIALACLTWRRSAKKRKFVTPGMILRNSSGLDMVPDRTKPGPRLGMISRNPGLYASFPHSRDESRGSLTPLVATSHAGSHAMQRSTTDSISFEPRSRPYSFISSNRYSLVSTSYPQGYPGYDRFETNAYSESFGPYDPTGPPRTRSELIGIDRPADSPRSDSASASDPRLLSRGGLLPIAISQQNRDAGYESDFTKEGSFADSSHNGSHSKAPSMQKGYSRESGLSFAQSANTKLLASMPGETPQQHPSNVDSRPNSSSNLNAFFKTTKGQDRATSDPGVLSLSRPDAEKVNVAASSATLAVSVLTLPNGKPEEQGAQTPGQGGNQHPLSPTPAIGPKEVDHRTKPPIRKKGMGANENGAATVSSGTGTLDSTGTFNTFTGQPRTGLYLTNGTVSSQSSSLIPGDGSTLRREHMRSESGSARPWHGINPKLLRAFGGKVEAAGPSRFPEDQETVQDPSKTGLVKVGKQSEKKELKVRPPLGTQLPPGAFRPELTQHPLEDRQNTKALRRQDQEPQEKGGMSRQSPRDEAGKYEVKNSSPFSVAGFFSTKRIAAKSELDEHVDQGDEKTGEGPAQAEISFDDVFDGSLPKEVAKDLEEASYKDGRLSAMPSSIDDKRLGAPGGASMITRSSDVKSVPIPVGTPNQAVPPTDSTRSFSRNHEKKGSLSSGSPGLGASGSRMIEVFEGSEENTTGEVIYPDSGPRRQNTAIHPQGQNSGTSLANAQILDQKGSSTMSQSQDLKKGSPILAFAARLASSPKKGHQKSESTDLPHLVARPSAEVAISGQRHSRSGSPFGALGARLGLKKNAESGYASRPGESENAPFRDWALSLDDFPPLDLGPSLGLVDYQASPPSNTVQHQQTRAEDETHSPRLAKASPSQARGDTVRPASPEKKAPAQSRFNSQSLLSHSNSIGSVSSPELGTLEENAFHPDDEGQGPHRSETEGKRVSFAPLTKSLSLDGPTSGRAAKENRLANGGGLQRKDESKGKAEAHRGVLKNRGQGGNIRGGLEPVQNTFDAGIGPKTTSNGISSSSEKLAAKENTSRKKKGKKGQRKIEFDIFAKAPIL